MLLFKSTDIKAPAKDVLSEEKAVRTQSNASLHLGKSQKEIRQVIGPIEKGKAIHFVTAAKWSMHEVLYYLLQLTGPAKVYFTTWSIKETPTRLLLNMVESGLITELNALFDFRVRSMTPEVYHLAKNNFGKIGLTSIHAKTTVIYNDEWQISIVSSANMTNNRRIERGVISCDKAVADFDRDWILFELNKSAEL